MDSPWVERILDLPALLEKKSYFLFGPRQTGKTFLIRELFKGRLDFYLTGLANGCFSEQMANFNLALRDAGLKENRAGAPLIAR